MSGGNSEAGQPSTAQMQVLLPVLVHIQTHLDDDLALAPLARQARLSPFHFHRVFRGAVGETLKQYSLRLRLERAALRLVFHQATILDVALDCGFQNHETFSRHFRRRFGVAPRDYRTTGRSQLRKSAAAAPLDLSGVPFQLSETKIRALAPLHLAFLRHVGPYEQVPDTLWRELAQWVARRSPNLKPVFMGLAHDAPGITPPEKLRFDAAIVVPGPFEPRGRIGYQRLEAGECALTTHVGHYSTLVNAYQQTVTRVLAKKGYRLVGLPGIEVYHTSSVNAQNELNYTDIYLPVVREGRRS